MTTHLGTNGSDKRSQIIGMRQDGMKVADIAKQMGLSKPSVYQYLKGADKAAKKTAQVSVAGGTLTVSPQRDGTFLVKVPADKLSAVAKVLA